MYSDAHSIKGGQASLDQLASVRDMRELANDQVDPTRVVALTIGDLLAKEFHPMEAVLSPWLRKQHLAMVYAKRGVGKTYFSLSLAYAVASGGRFLTWNAETPRKVLYIDGEMPAKALQERLAAIVRASPTEAAEGNFRIITPDVQQHALPDLGTTTGQAAFEPLLQDAELIVLDNLSTLVRAGVENEGESWLPVADWALARRREGRAVLFVHHAGKGGQQRGSSRREDLLDVIINLRHPSDYSPDRGAQFIVKFEKSRGIYGEAVKDLEVNLVTNADGNIDWKFREASDATRDRVVKLAVLGMRDADIARELGIHRSSVCRHRRVAEQSGLLGRIGGKA